MTLAVYPGSFDPPTNGHLDVIQRGSQMFSKLVVAVAENPRKDPLFSAEERVEHLKKSLSSLQNVEVLSFQGLIVHLCQQKKASVILRGIRTFSDFEYEFQMAFTNRKFDPTIETVFVAPAEKYFYISSSLIKEAIRAGGSLKEFVPPHVHERIIEKLRPSP
jgi:pantetheine-phosphate adenylyltransferase